MQHLSDKYGAKVTGVSLSEEQVKYGTELNKHNDGKIMLQDAMKLEKEVHGTFNKIGHAVHVLQSCYVLAASVD